MDTEKLRVLKKIKDRITSIRDDLYRVIDEDINAFTPGGYDTDDLPGAPPVGSILYDTARKTITWYNGHGWKHPTFVHHEDVLTEDVTVSNTTTKTVVHTMEIPAGSMTDARIFEVYVAGHFSTTNNSSEFTLTIDVGPEEVATLTSTGKNVTGVPFDTRTICTIRDVNHDLELMPHSRGSFDSVTNDDHHGQVAVDDTTPTTVTVSITWNEADAGNSVTVGQCFPRFNA